VCISFLQIAATTPSLYRLVREKVSLIAQNGQLAGFFRFKKGKCPISEHSKIAVTRSFSLPPWPASLLGQKVSMSIPFRYLVYVAIVVSVVIPRAFPNPFTEMSELELDQSRADALTFATDLPAAPQRCRIAMTSWLLTDPRAPRRDRAPERDGRARGRPASGVRSRPRPFRGRSQAGPVG
jgi:hypothetical protein